MILDRFNLNHIRIFECVYRLRSMTQAATELHMTQSGVSQHIKHLEEVLETPLFDRVKQKLIPTKSAESLYLSAKNSLELLESSLENLKGNSKALKGSISIGLPVEFGNSMVLPCLAKFASIHPAVSFNIRYGLASSLNDLILNGKMDLAFVDEIEMDPLISTFEIFQEILHLVGHENYLKNFPVKNDDKAFYLKADYIDYTQDESVLKMWFKHHLKMNNPKLNLRAHLMDVQGLAKLIECGMGLGVLPFHQIQKLQRQGIPLVIFRQQSPPLTNKISLATMGKATSTQLVKTLIDYLKKEMAQK